MSFSSGTFTLSQPDVVTGATISSAWANSVLNDIANNGLTLCITKNGQSTVTANIPFSGFRLTGIGAPTATGDALREGSAVGGTTVSTGAFTTLSATGLATFSGTGQRVALSGAGTSNSHLLATNTGGSLLWGIESSAGGTLFSAALAYSAVIGTNGATALHFATNNIVRGTFLSGGALVLGATAASGGGEKLDVTTLADATVASFKTTFAATPTIAVWNAATAGDNVFQTFYTEGGGTARGSIDYNRVGGAVRYNTTSDGRLKIKNGVAQYDPTWIARAAASIFDVTWKETNYRVDTFVAQDLYLVEPDAVKKGDDAELKYDESGKLMSDIWAIDPSKLIAKMVLEINALRAEFGLYKAANIRGG